MDYPMKIYIYNDNSLGNRTDKQKGQQDTYHGERQRRMSRMPAKGVWGKKGVTRKRAPKTARRQREGFTGKRVRPIWSPPSTRRRDVGMYNLHSGSSALHLSSRVRRSPDGGRRRARMVKMMTATGPKGGKEREGKRQGKGKDNQGDG